MINLSSNQNTQVEAHEEQVWDVEFNPNGRVFASASADKSVMLFENEGKVDRTLPHKSPVLCISFSPNGKYLASGTEDGMIHVWDLSSDTTEQTPKVEFQAHEKTSKRIDLSRRSIADLGGEGKEYYILELNDQQT